MFLRSLTGRDGRIVVPGLGLVAGTIASWSLSRREDSDPGNPGALSLHAVLSYHNDAILGDPSVPKKLVIHYNATSDFEVTGEFVYDGAVVTAKEVELCRA